MKIIYLAIAWLALGVAFLGVIIPGLPATEFFMLAAWAAGKSSPRLHRWMMNHRLIGPPLQDWKNNGVIRLRTKMLATTSMLIAAVVMVWHINHLPSLIFSIVGMSCGALWIWSRPSVMKHPAACIDSNRSDDQTLSV